jgi:Flp pilus assembly protein CpaB
MSTIAIVVIVLAVAGGITYLLMKKGKIKDTNNNNIPDAIEEKVEEVVVKVKEVKAKAEKVKAVAEKAVKAVRTPKAPTAKKTTKK